jgi:hypothetical protein
LCLRGGGNSLVGILHRIAAKMHNKYDIVGGVFSMALLICMVILEKQPRY